MVTRDAVSPRFSIAGLMGVVVVCGLGFAALRTDSPIWAHATLSLTLLALLTAILGAAIRRGRSRAFWLGFAVFGWTYLVLAIGPWFKTEISPHLPTTDMVNYLQGHIKQFPPGSIRHDNNLWVWDPATQKWAYLGQESERFDRTAHSLGALLVAVLGGLVGRLLYQRQFQSTERPKRRGQRIGPPTGQASRPLRQRSAGDRSEHPPPRREACP